jgi:hypothetical protein
VGGTVRFNQFSRADWHEQASCRGMAYPPPALTRLERARYINQHDALFFPPVESASAVARVQLLCNQCPVRVKCLDSAIALRGGGLWAGTTTAQRMGLRRKRHRAKCPACLSPNVEQFTQNAGPVPVVVEICYRCGASWLSDELPPPEPTPEPWRHPPLPLNLRGRRTVDVIATL